METYHKWILSILSVVLAAAIIVTIVVASKQPDTVAPGFTKPSFEENVVNGAPESIDEGLNYRTLEIGDGFIVSVCGTPTVDDSGRLDVYFTADQDNTVWTRLIILAEDGQQIGSTGLLKADEYVKSIYLDSVPVNGATVVMKILSYEPDTYYSMGSATSIAKVVN